VRAASSGCWRSRWRNVLGLQSSVRFSSEIARHNERGA
jgi:hypothetical protein